FSRDWSSDVCSSDLERSRSTPRLDAELRLRKLSIGRRPLGTGTVQARTESDRLVALASFDDEYGHLHVEAQVGTRRTPLFLSPEIGRASCRGRVSRT